MAQINLLPWREQLRQDKNKQFRRMLWFSGTVAVVMALLVWIYFSYLQSQQQVATAYLNEHMVQLDEAIASIKQAKQEQKMIVTQREMIEALHYQRSLLPRIWSDIANSVPQSLYLTGFTQAEGVMTLTGSATNATDVTNWVKALTSSPWLQQAQMHYVKQSKIDQSNSLDQSRYPFNFVVTAVPIEARQVAETIREQQALAQIQSQPISPEAVRPQSANEQNLSNLSYVTDQEVVP